MSKTTENLTNPGVDPVDGDMVRDTYSPTRTVTRQYHASDNMPASAVDVVFEDDAWEDYAYAKLGAIALPDGTTEQQYNAGMVRYGAILIAGRTSTEPAVAAAFNRYNRAKTFRKGEATKFLSLLKSVNPKIVEDNEFTAIIGDWLTT